MDFRILGPLEVSDGSRPLALGGEKQQALLAILLLHRNEVVSADRLIDELWAESPPAGARRTLRAYVSKLRRAMGANGAWAGLPGESEHERADGVLLTRAHGYVLQVAPGELDLERFAERAERGRDALAAGRPEEAARLLRDALSLWRGPPLAQFTYERFAQNAIAQLEELHLAAVEARVEADLALGHARDLVGELRDLVGRHPLRERLRAQLMLALYRSGRQAEALEVYQELRRTLAEELGLEPGPAVQQLERGILVREPSLELAASGVAAAGAPDTKGGAAVSGGDRRRVPSVLVAVVLVGLAIVAWVLTSRGGPGRGATVIPGDSVGAISPSGGRSGGVVALGGSPSAMASGDGAVWVASYNSGSVSRIDPGTRAVVETIPAVATPSGIAVGGRTVWVSNQYGGTVSRIDSAVDRVVQTVPVGNAPTGVAIGDGSVWVANSSDGTLSRIDAVTGRVTDTIALGAGATDLAAGVGGIWVTQASGNRVLRIDPQTDQVTAAINVGAGPGAVAVGFGSVWVANSLDGTVARVDPATNAVAATIAAGNGPAAVAVGDGAVWVANRYAGTVSEIDPAHNAVARTITVGNRPQALASAAGRVWVGAGAAVRSHRGGTLNVLVPGYPADTFDPALSQNLIVLLSLTNDGLTAYQHVGGSGSVQIVPDLAVSLPSPTDGGKTYTFQLRRGIRYSNGELVRPADFSRALERELMLAPSHPFADVVGGAACAARPARCDLSRGVVTDDAANTVTFHLVAADPELLAKLTHPDAIAVPAGTPDHDIGLHPLPVTGPYKWASVSRSEGVLVRNPLFHEWSHAARPDGYPDRIVFRLGASVSAELAEVERGTADYPVGGVPQSSLKDLQTRFARQLRATPAIATDALILNTRVAPFTDVRVRRAISYAIDRAKIARLLGQEARLSCQILPPSLSGYQRYCPYTTDPNTAGTWQTPNLAEANRLVAASHTRGTPITVWNFGGWGNDYAAIEPYLVSLLERLGYPTTIKDLPSPNAPVRFADSRTKAQAALTLIGTADPSAAEMIQFNFACQSFKPNSQANANLSEFCDPRLDNQISDALTAESNNGPGTAALWTQADRTLTNEAPAIPLATPTNIDFVSARVGNYQYNTGPGLPVLLDQLWVR